MRKKVKEYSGIKRQWYRALKNGLQADFTEVQWLECLIYFEFSCAYCGKHTQIQQDHIISSKLHGGYTRSNIVTACKSCNSAKNNDPMLVWYALQRFFKKSRLEKIYQWVGPDAEKKIKKDGGKHYTVLKNNLFMRRFSDSKYLNDEPTPDIDYFGFE